MSRRTEGEVRTAIRESLYGLPNGPCVDPGGCLSQEFVLQDFSGGMNALAGIDKLAQNECLLAENVRLDEQGNVASAGAYTHQNTSAYAAAAGTSTKNVHSTYYNPSIGAVSGVGQDVFFGKTLGGQASGLATKNTTQQKMSFASARSRVYFDVATTGYWSDISKLLAVDWAPPTVAAPGTGVTGPTTVGTGTQSGSNESWDVPSNITSTNTATTVSVTVHTNTGISNDLYATMTTNSFAVGASTVTGLAVSFTINEAPLTALTDMHVALLVGGVPVGTEKVQTFGNSSTFNTYTLGGNSDLWGLGSVSQAQVNAGNFGFKFYVTSRDTVTRLFQVLQGQMTVYQAVSGGFAVATGAAGSLTGTYTYKITFGASQGEESDASSDSNAVVLTAQQGTLTSIPTGDSRTTVRNVYRKGGALTSHYLVGSINDNVTTTYADNQTDAAALTEGDILAGDVPGDFPNTRLGSQQVKYPVLHYDRIFWIVPGSNTIVWSKPLNGFAYPVVNTFNVGDSKPCVRLVSIFGELIIIKTDSIWRLTGTDEDSFDLSQTPSSVGTDMPFTVCAFPDKIIFANRWGVWAFNGYTSQPLTQKLDLWFKQLDRTSASLFGVNGFHPPEVSSATVPANFEAVGNSEKYVLSYAESGQTQNNAILIFDLKHGNITKRTTGGNPLSLAIDPVTGFVYMGDAAGFVSLLDDWTGATQGGSNTNFDFQTGYIDIQRGSNKVIWSLEFYGDLHGQSLTPTIYYDNGTASETLAAISWTGLQRKVRPLQATKSRLCQNFSIRLNGSLTSVNSSGTPQVQLNHVKVYYDIRPGRARTGQ